MLSIDYSSSDEDIDDSNVEIKSSEDLNEKEVKELKAEFITNPFDANNYDLSSSEDEDEDNGHEIVVKTQKVVEISGVLNSDSNNERSIGSDLQNITQSKVSIFSNPFKEEEDKKLSQLERHVKLTDNKTNVGNSEDKKSKTICWSYNKHKRCRFGNRCRYKHNDTDFIDTKTIQRSDNPNKKRVGITDSLIPPKRALKAYYSQQNI